MKTIPETFIFTAPPALGYYVFRPTNKRIVGLSLTIFLDVPAITGIRIVSSDRSIFPGNGQSNFPGRLSRFFYPPSDLSGLPSLWHFYLPMDYVMEGPPYNLEIFLSNVAAVNFPWGEITLLTSNDVRSPLADLAREILSLRHALENKVDYFTLKIRG